MNPIHEASLVYEREACARTFYEDLKIHLLTGFVFSTPVFFIMGRPVIKDAPVELIENPSHVFNKEDCNCWHVYLLAGKLSPSIDIMPWWLPWLSMERGNKLRYHKMSSIKRLLQQGKLKQTGEQNND